LCKIYATRAAFKNDPTHECWPSLIALMHCVQEFVLFGTVSRSEFSSPLSAPNSARVSTVSTRASVGSDSNAVASTPVPEAAASSQGRSSAAGVEVSRPVLTLRLALTHPIFSQFLTRYLQKELPGEEKKVLFWHAVEAYRAEVWTKPPQQEGQGSGEVVYATYVKAGGPMSLSPPARTVQTIAAALASGADATEHGCFDFLQTAVFADMQKGLFRSFCASALFRAANEEIGRRAQAPSSPPPT
jgi:hypothetical protein